MRPYGGAWVPLPAVPADPDAARAEGREKVKIKAIAP
jgi:hypothetical protein